VLVAECHVYLTCRMLRKRWHFFVLHVYCVSQNRFMKYCLLFFSLFAALCTRANVPGHNKLLFVENRGQVTDQYHKPRKDIGYSLRTPGLTVFVGANGLHYQFLQAEAGGYNTLNTYRMDVTLVGANLHASAKALAAQDYFERYITVGTGKEGIIAHSSEGIIYHDVYPGIDWRLYTHNGALKHEFIVKPGGRVSDIKLKYDGAKKLSINEKGEIVATTPLGTITEAAPKSYCADGQEVASRYVLNSSELSYETAPWTGELVIDPGVNWSTYHGGTGNDAAADVTTDASGNVYMAGRTYSAASIATTGAHQVTLSGTNDAFIAKYSASGTLLWATYYGGSGNESGDAISTDASGNVYLAGGTGSSSGIATSGAHQATFAGGSGLSLGDAYVAKFTSAGVLTWATYYGGPSEEWATCVAADASGNVYLGGYTQSLTGISTPGCHQASHPNFINYSGYLVKFNSSGTRQWGTYYGGTSGERIMGLALDASANIYFVGDASSSTGISTAGAHQVVKSTGGDAMIVKFNTAGTRLWGTYFGNTGSDLLYDIALDGGGNLCMGGITSSPAGIATPGAFQTSPGSLNDGMLLKMNSSGVLQWATYYGGNAEDQVRTITVDASDNIYPGGFSVSTSGLASVGSYLATFAGGTYDGFFGKFSSAGARQWTSYFGGSATDRVYGAAISGNTLYMAGQTTSTAGISTTGAHQPAIGGTQDAFLTSFDITMPGAISGPTAFCVGGTPAFTCTPAGGSWSSIPSVVATIGGASGIALGVSPGTATIYYTLPSGTSSVVVTVSGTPTVAATTGVAFVCEGSTSTLSNATPGGVWSSTVPAVASVSGGVVSGVSTGTSTISYTVTSTCGTAAATTIVTVDNAPAATVTGTPNTCVGSTTTFVPSITGGTWSSSSTTTATISGGVVTGVAIGTVIISYTLTYPCATPITTVEVTVNDVPATATITGDAEVCPGETITLTSSVSGGAWSSSNTSVATVSTGIVTGVASGTAQISYTLTNSCGSVSATRAVTVLPLADCSSATINRQDKRDVLTVLPTLGNRTFSATLHSSQKQSGALRICDMTGREVSKNDLTTNKAEPLFVAAPGVYIVEATVASGRFIARIVVQ